MSDAAGDRDDRPDDAIVTGARLRRAARPALWQMMAALAVVAAALRLVAADGPLAPLLDLGWGLACVAVLGIGAHRNRGRGRLAWSLFSASVLCGAISMALFPWSATSAGATTVRDVLDLGAFVFGAAGLALLIRRCGGAGPDGWLDAAAMGVGLSRWRVWGLRLAGGEVCCAAPDCAC